MEIVASASWLRVARRGGAIMERRTRAANPRSGGDSPITLRKQKAAMPIANTRSGSTLSLVRSRRQRGGRR
jgi:hypothetical protein